ncbi:TRAP transporter small permease protein [Azorhizobium oxalatiphilum]|uniref:TRAP transporter small permease protein n=1 Tax=Azorhizobium oxalatiphilum TaxID=980631 RepID=A0A917C5C7_9HYPH|nr:TRAP transporter small permease [Azorhizobium oxalatiphilum]GGF71520.1 TRAP transporter small permease protein [Azorhizobium oxalatiphilum]
MSFQNTEARIRTISDWLCIAGGWGLVGLSIWIVVNVLLRKFASFSFQGVDEYGGYFLAIVSAAGFAKAALDKAHVRIDVVTRLFPLAGRAIFDVVALGLLFAMMWIIASKAVLLTYESWSMGALTPSVLRTPLWIPQSIWALALVWFTFVLAFLLVWAFGRLLRADFAGIEDKLGQDDIETEVAAEIADARARLATSPKETV